MNSIIHVALGGALGSVSRYLLGTWTLTLSKSINFLYGTLAVNLIGCFVIGFLSQLVEAGAFLRLKRGFLFLSACLVGLQLFLHLARTQ